MCIIYFIGKQSDMPNDVDSIFKHHDQAMELKASWLRKEKLCLMQGRSNVSQSIAI